MSGETKPNGTFSVATAQEIIKEHERVFSRTMRPAMRRWKQMYAGVNRQTTAQQAQTWGNNVDRSTNEDGEAYFDTNYAFMMVDTGRSNIVPGNPQVQIHPMSLEVDLSKTKTAEALVNFNFRQGRIRKCLTRMNGLTMLHGVSYLKAVYDTRTSRVKYDVIPVSDLFVDPMADSWEDVGYVIQKTTLPVAEVRQRFKDGRYQLPAGMTIEQAIQNIYVRANSNIVDASNYRSGPTDSFEWVGKPTPRDILDGDNQVRRKVDVAVIYELFDFLEDRYWHFAGPSLHPVFLSELPYKLVRNPFLPLVYNDPLEGTAGLSDMQLIEPLVQQIHFMDASRARHAQACIPRTLMNDDAVEDPDQFQADLLEANGPGHVVRVKLTNSTKYTNLAEIFHSTPQPSLMPEFAGTIGRLEEKVYETLGISPFQRGTVGAGRVATEFALADQANQTRLAERLQAIGDLLESAARLTLDLYNEFLPKTAQVYLRVQGAAQTQVASRETLPFFEGISAAGSMLINVVPYSPQETTRDSRLAKLTQMIPLLTQLDPEAVNIDVVASAMVEAAALPPGVIYSPEEKLARGQVIADAAAEADAAAAAQGVEMPPLQVGPPPVAPPPPPSRRGAAPSGQGGVPKAMGAMVGGAGR